MYRMFSLLLRRRRAEKSQDIPCIKAHADHLKHHPPSLPSPLLIINPYLISPIQPTWPCNSNSNPSSPLPSLPPLWSLQHPTTTVVITILVLQPSPRRLAVPLLVLPLRVVQLLVLLPPRTGAITFLARLPPPLPPEEVQLPALQPLVGQLPPLQQQLLVTDTEGITDSGITGQTGSMPVKYMMTISPTMTVTIQTRTITFPTMVMSMTTTTTTSPTMMGTTSPVTMTTPPTTATTCPADSLTPHPTMARISATTVGVICTGVLLLLPRPLLEVAGGSTMEATMVVGTDNLIIVMGTPTMAGTGMRTGMETGTGTGGMTGMVRRLRLRLPESSM
ncbi:hypothetical protein BDV98DRAFT_574465 [Pterulicium gracile]|uniref:Uncharacterized protein n=1 Tax=Pterulicium gracile TaxID=1884261 RepID=A0A5C3QGK4_9AGAR|nr:hypothetical protein BDV98DRAFT_574465 [Pterula gracilis]